MKRPMKGPMPRPMKLCPGCHEEKPPGHFNSSSKTADSWGFFNPQYPESTAVVQSLREDE